MIVLNSLLLGLETSNELTERFRTLFAVLNVGIQIVFLTEISIRLVSFWPKPTDFFRDGWNVFDFLVVTLSLLPVAGPFANVARLARVLRVARLISLSEELRLIIGTMMKSLPSMGHVGLLLGVLLYVYGILGFHFFSSVDASHWGGLGVSMLSLFKVLTLEGWIEMQDRVIAVKPWAWLYFVSFIVLAVFVVVNLFIAVVINNLETVKREQQERSAPPTDTNEILLQMADLREKLANMEASLKRSIRQKEE